MAAKSVDYVHYNNLYAHNSQAVTEKKRGMEVYKKFVPVYSTSLEETRKPFFGKLTDVVNSKSNFLKMKWLPVIEA